MARITKAALEAQVAALQAQVEQLNKQIAELEAINNMKREREARTPQAVRVPRTAYVAPAWQAERAAQMAAARELAMRIGRSVKVS